MLLFWLGVILTSMYWGYEYRKLEACRERELEQQVRWYEDRLRMLRERVNPWAKIQAFIQAIPEVSEEASK